MTLLADSLKRKWGVRILKKVKISLWKLQCFRLLYTCVFWLIIVRFGQIKHFWKWFNLFYSKMHNYLLLFHSEKMSGCCYIQAARHSSELLLTPVKWHWGGKYKFLAWDSNPRPSVHWPAALPTELAGQLDMGLVPNVFHYNSNITFQSITKQPKIS